MPGRVPAVSPAAEAALGPHEIVSRFVAAAINADKTYLRKRDLTEVRKGIGIWEQINKAGLLADAPPESLVEAHITVANMYARRYEVDRRPGDLDRSFSYLRRAEQHVIPGSDNDTLIKMSAATWLMLRFQHAGDSADLSDLDRAIAEYGEVIGMSPPGSVNAAVAAANLGRALLTRHRIAGSPADLEQAQKLLVEAVIKLGPDHPAAAAIQAECFAAMAACNKR
jgi:hypothetical protein